MEIEAEYNELLKRMVNKSLMDKPTTNINQYNMNYVIHNYTEAPNYEDLIQVPLTLEEKKTHS